MTSKIAFPKKIYFYIFREVWAPFLVIIAFLLLVVLFFQAMRLSDIFFLQGASLSILLKISKYLIISYLPILFPFSFLISILLGIGSLSASGEFGAIRAAGISTYHFSFPIIFSGLCVSIFSLFLNLYLVPWGNRMARYEILSLHKVVRASSIREGKFNSLFSDMTLHAEGSDADSGDLHGVFLHQNKEGRALSIMAKKGRFLEETSKEQGLPIVVVRLWEGVLHRVDAGGEVQDLVVFDRYDIFLRSGVVGMSHAEKPKTMDHFILKNKIRAFKGERASPELLRLMVEYWKRISLSWSSLVFAVLGVALGMLQMNALHSRAFLLALFIALVYWICYSAGLYWGEKGILPPVFAMWMGNLLLFGVALQLIRKASK